ncbi:energy-coupling factor ABC transporter ATP-binding protein [Micropruina glycogenica]|uniref:ABC transporter ATP-binding protein n=1 Tax=Micropruina glycogenica TaxID=75385 RepID=A0A2N9JKM3_9ACTN|nr:ATP-binding cassette domain-containing protein [Micropruina glycogenica]SPD88560.1 putative ABC transporter ATP-binding protein in cobA 5'region [Micropruina glycogenica]
MSHRQLSASAVQVSYGQRAVLRGADLEIPRARRLALLGANGSGKTTLLRTLAGSLKPNGGEVLVDGVALRFDRAGLRAHRQVVQLVAQNPDDQLFAADVFRDVSFGPLNLGLAEHEVRERVAEALAVLSIEDLAERPIHELSYGQRKRVAIAGALAMQPCVMLLDEPTAGLDPQGVDEMVGALESLLRAHTTVVISTHDVEFALGWADSVAVLVDGRVRHGAPNALLSDAGLVAAARLRQPLVLQAAGLLGLEAARVTDVTGLVAAIRDQGRLAEGVA